MPRTRIRLRNFLALGKPAPMNVLFDIGEFWGRGEFVESFTATVREQAPGVTLTPLVFGEPNDSFPVSPTGWDPLVYFSMKGSMSWRPSLEAMNQMVGFQSSLGFGSVRFLALKMLNRVDFTGTFRLLEREVIVHSAILAALDLLLEKQPSLVVFRVTPHEFPQFIVSEVAKYLELEVLHFQPCSIAPVMIPRYSSGKRFEHAQGLPHESTESKFILETARTQLRALQEAQSPTYMVFQRRRDHALQSFQNRLRAVAQSIGWIFRDRFPTSVDFSGHSNPQSFAARFLKVLLTRSLQRNLTQAIRRLGKDWSPAKPFALLALHYEPERTSLPDGLAIEFQADAVLQARAFLPSGTQLVVKEHYSQQSSALRGFLGRSPLFYDLIESLPGINFVGYNEKLTSLVSEAACVFTLTGTIAIEAVLRGIPVVYFGAPWWEGLPGAFRIDELASFDDLEEETVPEPGEILRFVEDLVLRGAIPGFASEAHETIVKRFGDVPELYSFLEGLSVGNLVALEDQG